MKILFNCTLQVILSIPRRLGIEEKKDKKLETSDKGWRERDQKGSEHNPSTTSMIFEEFERTSPRLCVCDTSDDIVAKQQSNLIIKSWIGAKSTLFYINYQHKEKG